MFDFNTNKLSDFAMIFIGLIVESLPFVIIGVMASALIAKFIKPNWILKIKSKNRFVSHIQTLFIGLFLPVCECGNIPLAKRLSLMGFRPSEVITFILAAPIFNPLVLITTLVAFNLDHNIAILRILIGGLIALIVGLIFSMHPDQDQILSEDLVEKSKVGYKKSFSIVEQLNNLGESKVAIADHSNTFVDTFAEDFFSVFKMLLIGCFLAALFQVLVPRDSISILATSPSLSVIALMLLAFLISICSSVDAFFALSLASVFNLGSILSFLIFGPMIDIKTLSMLKSIFKLKTLVLLTSLVSLLCLISGLLINYFYKLNYLISTKKYF